MNKESRALEDRPLSNRGTSKSGFDSLLNSVRESGTVKMPKELTAENGAKALLSGEFYVEQLIYCPDCDIDSGIEYDEVCETCDDSGTVTQRIMIDWDTIKRIYAKAVEHLAV